METVMRKRKQLKQMLVPRFFFFFFPQESHVTWVGLRSPGQADGGLENQGI